jgi:hypothetical protein
VLKFKRIYVSHDDRTHRPGECAHLHLRLDSRGGIVSCADCNASLSPFWALTMLSEQYTLALSNIDHLSTRLLLAHDQIIALTRDSARVVDGSKDS